MTSIYKKVGVDKRTAKPGDLIMAAQKKELKKTLKKPASKTREAVLGLI